MKNQKMKSISGKSAEEWQELLWDKLVLELSKINSYQELKNAIESLLSRNEKQFMLRRLAANALIRQGKSYKEIGEILWISSATISAIKKNLLNKHAHYKGTDFLRKEKGKLNKTHQLSDQSLENLPGPIERAVEGFFGVFFGRAFEGRESGDYFSRRVRRGK